MTRRDLGPFGVLGAALTVSATVLGCAGDELDIPWLVRYRGHVTEEGAGG